MNDISLIKPWLIAICSMKVHIPNLDASLDAMNQNEKAELSRVRWNKYVKKRMGKLDRIFLILGSIFVTIVFIALVYFAGPI